VCSIYLSIYMSYSRYLRGGDHMHDVLMLIDCLCSDPTDARVANGLIVRVYVGV
jgi:hypothetical protein